MKNRIIICHDTFSSPKDNWYSWLAKALESQGHSVVVPDFGPPNEQSLQLWKRVLWRDIGKLESDHILVGHGIGATFIANLLLLAFRKITGTFLVSGFARALGNVERDCYEASFVGGPFDWDAIRTNASQVKVYHADNDPLIPLSFGEELASNLGTNLNLVPGAGHFDAQSGMTEFPMLLNDILKVASQQPGRSLAQVNP